MRCFIAAWPDDATRRRLQHLIDALAPGVPQARPMQPRNLHLTLAFIGPLDDAAAAHVAGASGDLVRNAFEWSIDALGWFARASRLGRRLQQLAARRRRGPRAYAA
jgi:2'-5' RNA ligase